MKVFFLPLVFPGPSILDFFLVNYEFYIIKNIFNNKETLKSWVRVD